MLFVSGPCLCAPEEEISIDEEAADVAQPDSTATKEEAAEPDTVTETETAPESSPAPKPAEKAVPTPAPVAPAQQAVKQPETPATPVPPPAAVEPVEAGEETVDEEAPAEEATDGEGEEATAEDADEETPPPAPAPAPVVAAPAPVAPAPVPAVLPKPAAEVADETGDNFVIDEEENPTEGELAVDEGPETPRTFQWNPGDNKGAFAEFMNAGIADSTPGYFPSRIVSIAGESRVVAGKSEDVIISGNWRKGQVLAVYRTENGSRLYSFIGLLSVVAPSGRGNSRATVSRSDDSIEAGDKLLPVEQLQEDFSGQRDTAGRARLIQAGAEGNVICVGANRSVYSGGEDYLLVSRGKNHGVGLAWLCELMVPGKTGGTSYGRVVRVDPSTCFVKLMKNYQAVQAGDRVKLSISPLVEPGAKSPRKR